MKFFVKAIKFLHLFLYRLNSNIVYIVILITALVFLFAVYDSMTAKPSDTLIKIVYVIVCKILNLDEKDAFSTNLTAALVKLSIAASVLRVYFRQIGFTLDNQIARFIKKHAIVYGSSDEAIAMAVYFLKLSPVVLILDQSIAEETVSKLRHYGVIIYDGDGDDIDNLKACNISQARLLLAFRDEYSQNISLCNAALKQIDENSTFKCLCNVPDIQLKHSLVTSDFFNDLDLDKVKFVNQIEMTARNMLDKYPPDINISTQENVYPKIVLIGLGSIGQSLLYYLGHLGHYRGGHKPVVKIIDKNASQQYQILIKRVPAIAEIIDFALIETDINHLSDAQLYEIFGNVFSPSVVYVCTQNEVCNIVSAKKIQATCAKANLTNHYKIVLVDPPGGSLIQEFSREHQNIAVVPFLSNKSCLRESDAHLDLLLLFEYANDPIAKAIHHDYRLKHPGSIHDKDWDKLDESIRDANRFQAAHIEIKLRAIGRKIVPVDETLPAFTFTEHELLILSQIEHARWCAEKRLNGWTYAATRDDAKLYHNCLVDFDMLPDEIKAFDRDAIENIPMLLRTFNLMIG